MQATRIAVLFLAVIIIGLLAKGIFSPADNFGGRNGGIVEIEASQAGFANYTDYQPSPEMADLIDHLDLTYRGESLILSLSPSFVSRIEMTDLCGPKATGCFVRVRSGGRVDSVIAVLGNATHKQKIEALAHELLHGVYWQIEDTSEIDGWLDHAYTQNKSLIDNRLEVYGELSDYYRQHETHSFLGTITDHNFLSPLEAHYKRYFNDRQLIISHAPNRTHDDHDSGQPDDVKVDIPAPTTQSAPSSRRPAPIIESRTNRDWCDPNNISSLCYRRDTYEFGDIYDRYAD